MDLGKAPQRIAVIGVSGSGKTTLAREIAATLGIPHAELDALHWGSGRLAAPDGVFRARVERIVSEPAWVVDGNYGAVRDLIWARATLVIWLDPPLWLAFWRVIGRTLRRTVRGKVLWNGNRESLGEAFFNRKSVLLWVLRSHGRYRRQFPELLARPEYAHLRVVRRKWTRGMNLEPHLW